MPLPTGTKLGPYEISSPLGAGGMGEVYLAQDSRLGRCVAIKILPDKFSRDAQRMARFDREAKVLASLSAAISSAETRKKRLERPPRSGVGSPRRDLTYPFASRRSRVA